MGLFPDQPKSVLEFLNQVACNILGGATILFIIVSELSPTVIKTIDITVTAVAWVMETSRSIIYSIKNAPKKTWDCAYRLAHGGLK